MIAWQRLENAVEQKLIAKGIENLPRGPKLLDMAHREQLITSDQFKSLSGLRQMRNLAAHTPSGDINTVRLSEFLILADAMETVINISG